jgi:hypothetical protein
MSLHARPVSLVAQRAVRLLAGRVEPVSSCALLEALLRTRAPDEETAARLLETAFHGDSRLVRDAGGWTLRPDATDPGDAPEPLAEEPDRVLLVVDAAAPPGSRSSTLRSLAAIRVRGDLVVTACGGSPVAGRRGGELRRAVAAALEGAVPVLHDPPGALAALERWLGRPLDAPISLRRLAQRRLALPAGHDLERLAAALGLSWRDPSDPLELAETLEECLQRLRRPQESLEALRRELADRYVPRCNGEGLDPEFIRSLPEEPGVYRFYDADDRLLYVGKARNLRRRLSTWFSASGRARPARAEAVLGAVRRLEVEPTGSELEALLREATQIRARRPEQNVQQEVHARHRFEARAILILEPGAAPAVLQAYLIRDGRLVGRVSIGPRGGGLGQIERLLARHFFGDEPPPPGREMDVEVIRRWLSANRDRVVAFDPTDLPDAAEVTRRLRWFLDRGALREPDGTPPRIRG